MRDKSRFSADNQRNTSNNDAVDSCQNNTVSKNNKGEKTPVSPVRYTYAKRGLNKSDPKWSPARSPVMLSEERGGLSMRYRHPMAPSKITTSNVDSSSDDDDHESAVDDDIDYDEEEKDTIAVKPEESETFTLDLDPE